MLSVLYLDMKKKEKDKKYKDYEDNIINGNIKYKDSYKVVFIGSSGIGAKTSLIERIVCNTFSGNSNATSGASFGIKEVITKEGIKIKLDLWDTAGQEKYRELTKFFCKDADCIVFGYDITRKSTFEDIKSYWIPQVKSDYNRKLVNLIGCKIDCEDYRTVGSDEAEGFAEQNNLRFFEVSNKYNEGIDEFVEDLANHIRLMS